MKKLFSLLFFIPALLFAQNSNQDSILSLIPNDATTIKLNGVKYKEFCLALLDSSYDFETRDPELETFKTKHKAFKKYWNCTYSIEGRFKDTVAYLKFRLQNSPILLKYARWQRSKNKYPEKSLYNYPFIEVINFCKKFTNHFEFIKEDLE